MYAFFLSWLARLSSRFDIAVFLRCGDHFLGSVWDGVRVTLLCVMFVRFSFCLSVFLVCWEVVLLVWCSVRAFFRVVCYVLLSVWKIWCVFYFIGWVGAGWPCVFTSVCVCFGRGIVVWCVGEVVCGPFVFCVVEVMFVLCFGEAFWVLFRGWGW